MRQDSQLVAVLKFAPFLSWLPKDVQTSIEKKLSRLLLSAIEPSVMLVRLNRNYLIWFHGSFHFHFITLCVEEYL